MKIYTIGVQKKDAKTFFEALRSHKVEKILDVRLRNSSQLLGFAKGRDLEYIASEGFGIKYEHVLEFAPTETILDRYLKKTADHYQDWEWYREQFSALLDSRPILSRFEEASRDVRSVVLLCSEPDPEKCHRGLLADYLSKCIPDVSITHL